MQIAIALVPFDGNIVLGEERLLALVHHKEAAEICEMMTEMLFHTLKK